MPASPVTGLLRSLGRDGKSVKRVEINRKAGTLALEFFDAERPVVKAAQAGESESLPPIEAADLIGRQWTTPYGGDDTEGVNEGAS